MSSTTRLTYFKSPGRAEPVRIALFLAGIPFTDERLGFPEFMQAKQNGALPLGSVPVLEHGGRAFAQTAAMLRFAGRVANNGLYPDDPEAGLVVDSAIDTFNDTVAHALRPSFWEKDDEKKLAMRRAFVDDTMATCFRYVEGLIKGPFLLGDQLTIADLVIGGSISAYESGQLDGITRADLAPFPRLLALGEAYRTHPDIVRYYAQATK